MRKNTDQPNFDLTLKRSSEYYRFYNPLKTTHFLPKPTQVEPDPICQV